MPLVDITLFEGRTDEQKTQIARAISRAFIEIGNARPDSVHVIFRDVDRANWKKSSEVLEESQE
jgi:4-oxalocrotonate tautomerase